MSFVIGGADGLAKTALCKSIAAEYARCRNVPYFVCSSTADSLRTVCVRGFFRENVAVVLVEWRIGRDSQDQHGHKVDFVKCLTDIENPSSCRMRYSDIKFSKNMPRIISSQAIMQDWIVSLRQCDTPKADIDAVTNRLLFLHVTRCLIPEHIRKQKMARLSHDLRDAMQRIGVTDAGVRASNGVLTLGWTDM